jgi:PAS domain S-box-containing protein/diguanylate cyclase (GGDEF)-like protein
MLCVVAGTISIKYIRETLIDPLIAQIKKTNEKLEDKRKIASENKTLLEQYKRIVDESSIVSKSDKNGIITYVNDEFCKISGYTTDELIGKPHSIIRHPDMEKSLFKELWCAISKKNTFRGIIKNRAKDGRHYYVDSTIVPILDDKGEIVEYISMRNNVTSLIDSEKRIKKQTTDKLTALPNRQKLIEDIDSNESGILATILINGFREINDYYGYEVGNRVLVEIAKRLKQYSNNGQIYKIAGDEFAIFSQNCDTNRFITTIEVVIEYFVYNTIIIEDNKFHISLVAGISSGKNNIYLNSEYALQRAIKSDSKFIYFDGSVDLQKEFQENILMTAKIKDAIDDDRIAVYAQPIICNKTGKLKKYETLMRMIDDNNKVISPYFFLNIAKKARLYPILTKIVIERAFSFFENKECDFSINLTIDDIKNREIIMYIKEQLQAHNVANRLIFEIVESEGIERYKEVAEFIANMKEMGCKIAIDDFGTGYSNFEYLMKLNVDIIKIDGSMIKNITEDKNAELVVSLMINFAKNMGIETVAEYVHSKEVHEKIIDMGIDYSQGFYLGEPTDIREI